ncbi:MAG: tRNA (guanosine(46)-N7)-methyltransferase TrmB [Gammaproteobacteria bacterium]|nr:tRNA (guanosine(46)-N7)-methyltransferase TrmB [Gammaproteobacteria bacterium]
MDTVGDIASSHSANPGPRTVQSFVRREGRLTRGQSRALQDLWPDYGIEPGDNVLNPAAVFGREAPVTLEIGFGNGESLAQLAATHSERNFLGVEVHRPGLGRLLRRIEALGLANVRLVCGDAVELLEQNLPPASLNAVLLWYPDPWPKKRHHKRRIVQPRFVRQIHRALRDGGIFHMATDWQDYARHMMAVMEEVPGFANRAGPRRFSSRPGDRPVTKFECRGNRLGHVTRDLVYTRDGTGT